MQAVPSAPEETASVERFLAAVGGADGHPPLSEHKLQVVRNSTGRLGVWTDTDGIWLVGSAAHHDADGHWAVEAAVAERSRVPRLEREAIGLAAGLVPDGVDHTLWAFRDDQVAAARDCGYRGIRSVVRLSGDIVEIASVTRSDVRIGPMDEADVDAVVSINNRAFAGHPEQGAMTAAGFRSLAELEWFEMTGVLLARSERGIGGFCITKLVDRIGEVYVVAVDPDFAGLGIGRALTTASYRLLGERGATEAQVWTDESNRAAMSLYWTIGLSVDFRTRELTIPLWED